MVLDLSSWSLMLCGSTAWVGHCWMNDGDHGTRLLAMYCVRTYGHHTKGAITTLICQSSRVDLAQTSESALLAGVTKSVSNLTSALEKLHVAPHGSFLYNAPQRWLL